MIRTSSTRLNLATRGFRARNGVRVPVVVSVILRVADHTDPVGDSQKPVVNDNVLYHSRLELANGENAVSPELPRVRLGTFLRVAGDTAGMN